VVSYSIRHDTNVLYFYYFHSSFIKPVMVSVAVPKMGVVLHRVRDKNQWTILLGCLTISSQEMLAAIKDNMEDFPSFSSAPAHCVQCKTHNFLSPEL